MGNSEFSFASRCFEENLMRYTSIKIVKNARCIYVLKGNYGAFKWDCVYHRLQRIILKKVSPSILVMKEVSSCHSCCFVNSSVTPLLAKTLWVSLRASPWIKQGFISKQIRGQWSPRRSYSKGRDFWRYRQVSSSTCSDAAVIMWYLISGWNNGLKGSVYVLLNLSIVIFELTNGPFTPSKNTLVWVDEKELRVEDGEILLD